MSPKPEYMCWNCGEVHTDKPWTVNHRPWCSKCHDTECVGDDECNHAEAPHLWPGGPA